jgi:hypothetical protein
MMKVTVQDIQLVEREIEVDLPVYRRVDHDLDKTTVTTFQRIEENGLLTELAIWKHSYTEFPKYEFHQESRPLGEYKDSLEKPDGQISEGHYRWTRIPAEEFDAAIAAFAKTVV